MDRGREKAMEGKKRWCPTSARDVGRAWGGQSLGNSSPVRTSPLQVPSLPYAPHLCSSVETLWMEVAIPLDCSQGRPGSQVSPGSWGLRQAHKDADGDGDGDVRWKPRANAQGSLRPRWERSALRCPVHPSGDSSSASKHGPEDPSSQQRRFCSHRILSREVLSSLRPPSQEAGTTSGIFSKSQWFFEVLADTDLRQNRQTGLGPRSFRTWAEAHCENPPSILGEQRYEFFETVEGEATPEFRVGSLLLCSIYEVSRSRNQLATSVQQSVGRSNLGCLK